LEEESKAMYKGVEHVGIAVKNLDEAVRVYRDVLGFRLEGIQTLAERKLRIALFSTGGETQIELLESLDKDNTIAKFVETHGEGIHHFAVETDDIEASLENLKKSGAALIDEKPRAGAEGKQVAFIHPKSTKGVLLELVKK
jgi:methylmalonyl-CoA/ethylmalonyl-CoA epimerase